MSESQSKNPIQKTNYPALYTLITVFFFWGFIAAGNSIFIPFCKNYFGLDQFQSQLIDFAFYLAYYVGALILFMFGSFNGKDLVGKWGYKKSIVYGLLFSALGAVAMIVAVQGEYYYGMLIGLFIVALGFSLQQTAAQPFAILLGDPKTGATRVNLGGAINSLGTTIGPLIIALALFGSAHAVCDDEIKNLPLDKVIFLYVCVGALFIGAAALFGLSKKVPKGINEEVPEKANKALYSLLVITGLLILVFVPVFSSYQGADAQKIQEIENTISERKAEIAALECETYKADEKRSQEIYSEIDAIQASFSLESERIHKIKEPLEKKRLYWLLGALAIITIGLPACSIVGKKEKVGWGAMQFPQLVLGMLAIFMYVGVEVAIGSNLGELLKQGEFGGYKASQIAPFIAMYWGSLMIGRWTGAIGAFNLKNSTKTLLKFVVPLLAFGLILLVTYISGHEIEALKWYILCVLVQIVAAYLTKDNPVTTLFVFGLIGIAGMLIGMFTTGQTAIYAFLSGGLACSIMWPCIFSLSIAGLGKYTTQGSAFLIMMILGGGIIPPIQGKLADVMGIQESFFIPVLCFAYLTIFALMVKGILKKQGINYEEEIAD